MMERKKADIAQKKIDNVEQILGRIQQAESDTLVSLNSNGVTCYSCFQGHHLLVHYIHLYPPVHWWLR